MKTTAITLIVTATLAGCASSAGYTPRNSYESGQRNYDSQYRHEPQYRSNYGQQAPAYSNSAASPWLGAGVGAVAGGLLSNQVGQGNGRIAATALGAAAGAIAGSNVSDPCQPGLNGGHLAGGAVGALLGAQVGQGNGRSAAAAIGAVAGALAGGSMAGQRECR